MKKSQGVLKNLNSKLSFLKISLNRRGMLEAAFLGMVVILAIIFRTMRVRRWAYLDAYDPLFQLRVTKYIVDNGYASWFTWHDTLSWYPWGRNIPRTSFPGVPFTGAFVYYIVNALGFDISIEVVCLYFPVLMGVITTIIAYFLGKDLGGKSTGLFSAFFMAISEAFIGRTALGFYDTENIGIFGMTIVSLLFLRSIDENRTQNWRILYGISTGLSMGYIFASWGAARYIVGLLVLFILVTLVTGKFERRHLISYALTLGVGYFIAYFVPRLGGKYLTSIENLVAMMLVVLLVVYDTARKKFEEKSTIILIGVLILTIIIGVFMIDFLGLSIPIKGKFLRVLNPFQSSLRPLSESVAEHKRAVWSVFFGSYGFTFSLAILGTYFAINNIDDRRLFCSLFFITAVYFTGSMTRLSLILSIPVAIMAAYGLSELLSPFIVPLKKIEGRGRRQRLASRIGVNRELALVFILFILVCTMPIIWGTAEDSLRPASLASSGVPALMGGRYPQDWLQALSWMHDNIPEDAIVVSWWDYGYWIEEVAGKITLADGATGNSSQIGNIGKIMMLNYTESLHLLEMYDATHIVVFTTFNPGDPQQQWPFGDNVKWQWMVQIPGMNVSEYYDREGVTEKYLDSTLNRLMTLNPSPGFELVFASDYRFVMVYEINYDAIK